LFLLQKLLGEEVVFKKVIRKALFTSTSFSIDLVSRNFIEKIVYISYLSKRVCT
jgi:hypothetical protein